MNKLSKEEFKKLIEPFKIRNEKVVTIPLKDIVENKQRLDLILGINLLYNWITNLPKNISYKTPEQLEFNFT